MHKGYKIVSLFMLSDSHDGNTKRLCNLSHNGTPLMAAENTRYTGSEVLNPVPKIISETGGEGGVTEVDKTESQLFRLK